MPNLTMYIAAEQMPEAKVLDGLAEQCAELCTETLGAALDNVHIIFVPARRGRGQSVFAEILLREEPFRSPEVIARFMHQLDDAITNSTGLSARIRCFSFAQQHVHARN